MSYAVYSIRNFVATPFATAAATATSDTAFLQIVSDLARKPFQNQKPKVFSMIVISIYALQNYKVMGCTKKMTRAGL